MVQDLNTYISTIQIGITLFNLGIGWLGEPAFEQVLRPLLRVLGAGPEVTRAVAIGVSLLLMTGLTVVVGELVPKALALANPEATVLAAALPLSIFHRVVRPFTWGLQSITSAFLSLLRLRSAASPENVLSEEELRILFSDAAKSGGLAPETKELLERAFVFRKRIVREVMVPRGEIVYLSTMKSLRENFEITRQHLYTRYPLCEGDVDRVVGMVHVKDLVARLQQAVEGESTDIRELAREMVIVPEMVPVARALREFQVKRTHMAIAVDEYGLTAGLVTLEDVLEELVGEIQDEFDQESPRIRQLPDGSLAVDGMMLLDELAHRTGVAVRDDENDTIGGHVMGRLGRTARPGDTVPVGDFQAKVTEVKGFRIKSLLLVPRQRRSL
jgi:CBS domain containing-hemolysin-like protein